MQLGICQSKAVNFLQPLKRRFILRWCCEEHFTCLTITCYLIRKHLVIDESHAAKCLCEQNTLLFIGIYSEFIRPVHELIPCCSIYYLTISIGAPPVVSKQKLLDQNISFHNFLRTAGYFFFISRDDALL